jgi:hypothetical protein
MAGTPARRTMMFGGSPASGTGGFRNVPNVELSDPFTVPRQNSLLVKVRNQTCDNETETIPTPSHAASASVGSGRWMSKQKIIYRRSGSAFRAPPFRLYHLRFRVLPFLICIFKDIQIIAGWLDKVRQLAERST